MDDKAYTGSMLRGAGSSDFGTMDFVVRRIIGRSATTTLVQVLAVHADSGGGPPKVDVQPMVNQIDGKGDATPHGTVYGIPSFRYQGGAGAFIVDPAVGDIGIAVFASEDISSVTKNRARSNPGSRRRFSMSDGLYLGGVINAAPTNFVEITDAGIVLTFGAISMAVTATGVAITGGTVTHNGVPIGATHIHSGVSTGTADSGPPV